VPRFAWKILNRLPQGVEELQIGGIGAGPGRWNRAIF